MPSTVASPAPASLARAPGIAQLCIAYATMVVASSSLEAIWYLGIAEDIYQQQIGSLLNAQFDLPTAVLFYLVYALGALVFAVRPALQAGSWTKALRAGAMYGFFCFSAHNLTDLADVRGFTARIAGIDIAWGVSMSATAATLSCLAARRLARARA
jgi:uncharacterized membrane protein